MTQEQISYLARLHQGQWFGFDGEQTYENLWVNGFDKPTLEDIEQGMIDFELIQWRQSTSLSSRKFKIGEAIYKVNGTPLVELIEALLAGLPEPQKTVASISYNESNSFDRLDAFVVQFGQALEMSEEEVDDFFQFCIDEAWQ
jgi:hypothetical protein